MIMRMFCHLVEGSKESSCGAPGPGCVGEGGIASSSRGVIHCSDVDGDVLSHDIF